MRTILTLTAVTVMFAANTYAATVRVPQDEPTIQAGIDAAQPGDLVLVAAGTYTGTGNRSIRFDGKDVELRSESGAESTIIDCQASEIDPVRAFEFLSTGESSAAIVDGFTIRNGYVTPTDYPTGWGGGMIIDGAGTSPTIRNCTFEGNNADGGGGGLVCGNGAEPSIESCRFLSNVSGGGGGGMVISISSARVTDCVFSDNESSSGGGIYCIAISSPTVTRCSFSGHESSLGGGMYVSTDSSPVLTACTFADNTARRAGGAFYCDEASASLTGCVFLRSGSGAEGGAVYCQNATVTVESSTLFQSSAVAGSGIYATGSSSVTVERSIIGFGAQAEAVACDGGATVSLSCSDVFGNQGGDWSGCIAGQEGAGGNLSADPQFCDPAAEDLGIAAGSPCAPAQSGACGLIGALDVTCTTPNPVEHATWGALKASYLRD